MAFYTDTEPFTHKGSFYGIPVYLNTDENKPIISGTNVIYDWLFMFMILFHNIVIERITQFFVAVFNLPYEAGFPFTIKEKLKK